jgi:hypothetical protein
MLRRGKKTGRRRKAFSLVSRWKSARLGKKAVWFLM